jgi:hypothetical protein
VVAVDPPVRSHQPAAVAAGVSISRPLNERPRAQTVYVVVNEQDHTPAINPRMQFALPDTTGFQ